MRQALILVLCALMLAGCASRRPRSNNPPPRDENFHGGPNALLLKYDANHDGSLTRAELEAGLKAEFDGYDTGHKGCLDIDQVRAINQARISTDLATATTLQDWNDDGCVDLREFSTAANSLFQELDKNGDGTISPLEFNPRPARGGGAPPQGDRARRQ